MNFRCNRFIICAFGVIVASGLWQMFGAWLLEGGRHGS
jgi:hypothetical protein